MFTDADYMVLFVCPIVLGGMLSHCAVEGGLTTIQMKLGQSCRLGILAGGFDIMMLIKSISLSGAVSCNLVTRCWRCITETLFIEAVLLLFEGPGQSLEL